MTSRLICGLIALALLLPASGFANKAYPTELRRAFMESCVGLSKELVEPCRCVLSQAERSITAEDLQKQLASGTIAKDPRFTAIARQCSGQTGQKRQ